MLSNIQLELLKTFSRPLPESQLLEIKKLLSDYFAQKIDEGVDKLFEENNWIVNEKIAEWKNEHMRTPYKSAK